LTKDLIKKKFPELANKKILVFVPYFFRNTYSGVALWIPPFSRMLFINKERASEGDYFLRGLISHELGHQSLYATRSFFKNAKVFFLYWLNTKARRNEEDEVNKLIIKKGFAKDIYEATKKIEKKKESAGIQKYYMSSEEIKDYAKKVGKW
jgi:hypothetical protein